MVAVASWCDHGVHHERCDCQDSSDDQDGDDGQHEADVKCTHDSNPFFPGSLGRVQAAIVPYGK